MKVYSLIFFILFPFYSVCQTPDFYEMYCKNIRMDFFKYSSEEKLNQFDTVLIYGYNQNNLIVDSTLISKVFVGKLADTSKIIKNKRGFILESGQRGARWLYSDKTFNAIGQLTLNTLYYNDNDICCRVKYLYKNKDTLSITKYVLTSNEIFEQSFFKYKKGTVEKTTYNYNSCIQTSSIKRDKFNRIIYNEYCYCDNTYSIKPYYTYTDSSLTIKTEYPIGFTQKIITDIYKYNSFGLIKNKTSKIIAHDSLIYPFEYYNLIKFFYK